MKNLNSIILAIIITIGLSSCYKQEQLIVNGKTPLYISASDFSFVKSDDPRSFTNLGNIVIQGNFIYINEKGKGIHVIDNTDPSNPITIAFLNIPGNTEFNIDGKYLYADNSIHLLTIDISDIHNIEVKSYTKNIFINLEPLEPRPPFPYRGYFYCVRKEFGIHVGWKEIELIDPDCETL